MPTVPPPPLAIEENGTWTPRSDYQAFIDWVEQHTDGEVSTLGISGESRLIHQVVFGTGPEHGGVFIRAGIHGNEPAGREAALQLIRDLAIRDDSSWDDLLARTRITVLPDTNPDGRERNITGNSEGVNLNRQTLLLNYPEQQAVQDAYIQARPSFTLDLHETSGPGQEPVDFWGSAGSVDTDRPYSFPPLVHTGQEALDACFDALGAEGLDYDLFNTAGTTHPFMGVARGLHSVSLLTETRRILGNFDPELQVRRAWIQKLAIRSTLDYFHQNLNEVRIAWEGSQEWVLQHPGPDLVNLTRYTIDPAIQEYIQIEGYVVPNGVPDPFVDSYDLEVERREGMDFVPMNQWARRIIPLLLDPLSVGRGVEGAYRVYTQAKTPAPGSDRRAYVMHSGAMFDIDLAFHQIDGFHKPVTIGI